MEDLLTLVKDTLKICHSLDLQPCDFYLVTYHGLDVIAKSAERFRVTDKKKAIRDHLLTFQSFRAGSNICLAILEHTLSAMLLLF